MVRKIFYWHLVRGWLVVAVGLLGSLAAQAQHAPTDTASFVLSTAKLQGLQFARVRQPHRLVLLSSAPAAHGRTQLTQYWCDDHLRLRRRTQVELPGKLMLASADGTDHHLLAQLLSRDSLVLAAIDTLGRLVAQVRQPLSARRGAVDVRDISLPQADAFISIEQQRQSTCRLVCRNAALALRWEQTFGPSPEATLLDWAADETHLWVLLMAGYELRHPVSTAVCLELATGRELGRTVLTNEQARRVPSVLAMGPDHSLLVAGHAFNGQAAVLRNSGDLFVQRLSPGGQVLVEYVADFEKESTLHGAAAERVQWQLIWPSGQQVHLVGETYTSTTTSEAMAAGFLTMGIRSNAVLRPKELVSLTLGSQNEVTQLQVVPLPADKGEFSAPFAPPRTMARLALAAGAFRTRGLAHDSTLLVLRSPQQVQALSLATGKLQPVRAAPAQGLADVLEVGNTYLIIAEADSKQRTLRLLRVPLPLMP